MSEKPFDDDPTLGQFVAYHPSNRRLLLIQGALAYGVPVLFLQLFFIELDDDTASIVLIALYALLALGVGWYVLNRWNKEVMIYERGFTYREGSRTVAFFFSEIERVRFEAQRVLYFGMVPRNLTTYTLITDRDETMILNNQYRDVQQLGLRIEKNAAQVRLPAVQHQIQQGKPVDFGDLIRVNPDGIQHEGRVLAWDDLRAYRTQGGRLILDAQGEDAWASIKISAIDNAVLLVNLLKERLS